MAGSVLNSTAVLRLNFCAKLNICASISATSPSRKTLAAKLAERLRNKTSSDKQIPFRLRVLTGKDGGKNNEEQQFNKSEEHKKR